MFELFYPTHLLFILLVALVVFGPKRLMQMSRSLGQSIRSIQEYKEELEEELYRATEDEPGKKSPEKKG